MREFTELVRSEIASISDRYLRCLSGRSLDQRQESGVRRYIWFRNRWWSKTEILGAAPTGTNCRTQKLTVVVILSLRGELSHCAYRSVPLVARTR